MARLVVPKYPHHIIQRGNRRQQVFFKRNDYEVYLRLLKFYSNKFNLKVLCYCLMPNHVHLIVIPAEKESLCRAIGETHRNYTAMINKREKWYGYLWQGRFHSYVLDKAYLQTATRYILLNPIEAKIVKNAQSYEWSSIRVHLGQENNALIKDGLLQEEIKDWKDFLDTDVSVKEVKDLRQHESTGRPLGEQKFVEKLEKLLKIRLHKQKPGRKKNNFKN